MGGCVGYMNGCMDRLMDGGWINGQEGGWMGMDGRVAGVSLRAQVCGEIPNVSSTASAHVLSRLAPGHVPLWEHLHESAFPGSGCHP